MKITLCGSMAFYKKMVSVRDELVNGGHEVKLPEFSLEAPKQFGGGKVVYIGQYIEENGGIDAFPAGHEIWELKRNAINDHNKKIEWADVILVINEDKRGIKGYVGGNTLIEIGTAFYLKKKIFMLNPVSSELSYKQEIMGMMPVVIDGDLMLVK